VKHKISKSRKVLGITQAKAKMHEYNIPEEYHEIDNTADPSKLFLLTIGILGEAYRFLDVSDSDKVSPLKESRESLQFAAKFFDSYIQSKIDNDLDPYLLLLGSVSYYVCGLPGSACVLSQKLEKKVLQNGFDIGGEEIELVILWLLGKDLGLDSRPKVFGRYSQYLSKIIESWSFYFMRGIRFQEASNIIIDLQKEVISSGNDRQLFLINVLRVMSDKKHANSCWSVLPKYSGLSKDKWKVFIEHGTFRELWPAQHLLGSRGIFKGNSAIIQMPTSAGKTKATELIIRSSFLSDRTKFAVIVAPFRSLCHEINDSFVTAFLKDDVMVNEISDVFQFDFDEEMNSEKKKIIILTPEKFLYILRQNSEMTKQIGLIIFDEGHQFDNDYRGVIYELLITSLKKLLAPEAQKILISAVINNAEMIGEWLIGSRDAVVVGSDLLPTHRTIGFVNWPDQWTLGQVQFVEDKNINKKEFFVPRVLKEEKLSNFPRETKERVFPNRKDSNSIALYLGLKLVSNGGVAIFCGRKETPQTISKEVIDIYKRGYQLPSPKDFSDAKEVEALKNLFLLNFGEDAVAVKSAKFGIFTHHANVPQGLRIAIEHSMRKELIKFVICTSTLAQGVNLPMRYLIVTSINQGGVRLKVRDFHNLMGRVGRSGMYTEGSVLFSDTNLYKQKWRRNQISHLMNANNSEICTSSILSIFEPFGDGGNNKIELDIINFLSTYLKNPEILCGFSDRLRNDNPNSDLGTIDDQINHKLSLVSALQSFLLSQIDVDQKTISPERSIDLCKETLAYHLGTDEEKEKLLNLFNIIAENTNEEFDDVEKRKIYGKILLDIKKSKAIENWIQQNLNSLYKASTIDEIEILKVLWPLLNEYLESKCPNPNDLLPIALSWIDNKSFYEILIQLKDIGIKKKHGEGFREYTIDDIVSLCEHSFSYNLSLILGAVIQFIKYFELNDEYDYPLIGHLLFLQKKLKYGISSITGICLYELGFMDRTIISRMIETIELPSTWDKELMIRVIKNSKDELQSLFEELPFYYRDLLGRLILGKNHIR
jgi:hypothetical protein